MKKTTELDANELISAAVDAWLATGGLYAPSWSARQEPRAAASVGCHGDCVDSGECTCSHASAPRRPRQPRLPEPRTPHLPLRTRLSLLSAAEITFYACCLACVLALMVAATVRVLLIWLT